MRQCKACGSTNITEVNQDNDYSDTLVECECMMCGQTSNFVRHKPTYRWNYDRSKSAYNKQRMGKTG